MRILLISDNFWPVIGGAEVLIAKLLPALQERGFEFVVLTQRNVQRRDEHATYHGIPIVEHALTPDFWQGAHEQAFEAHRQVAALKREFRPELVHLWLASAGAVLHWQTMSAHVAPTLLTLHLAEPDERVRPRTILGTTYRRADWLAACSSPLLAQVRQQIPQITPRSSAVLNGIEPTTIQPAPLPWAPARLLFVGRLHPQKGVEVLLDAFARLAPAQPGVDLTIAGDGILRHALEQRAANLGIAERVEFLGWVAPDQVQPLMNQATIVIMPSRDEGLPLVALQAAQLGRPIVATPAGGLADIVIHELTGLQVPIEDSATLAAAIDRLLGDPRLAETLGQRCRAHVAQTFSWEGCLAAYAALYRRLIAAGPGQQPA